jgi:uncharacterized protein (DUF1501 family)
MKLLQPHLHTRRAFLARTSQLALTGIAAPVAVNLAAFGEAAAFDASDYKALVCVFLYGANDHANTVVAYDDANYNKYHAIRNGGAGQTAGGIALAKAALAPTLLSPTTPLADGWQYALHPSMPELAALFNAGKAAIQLNVGPLIVPLTKAQYNSQDRARYPLPPKLFSHNDQQSVWQASGGEGATVGWGGAIGDLALGSNLNATFTCISATGQAVFLSGQTAIAYQVGTNGAVAITATKSNVYGSSAVRSAITELIQQARTHTLENEYNRVTQRSVSTETTVTGALAAANLTTAFPANNALASQLQVVARLIASRNLLGAKRQVYMVSLGGFDLHDNLIDNHPTLLQRVSQAMNSFYNATVELGIADKVTAFTASDFGRTLSSNGDGSDHGWGGHHFVVGGAVRGKVFYGTPPPISTGNTTAPEDQWHVGQGRLLPSTSVDQFAATLGRWFGVSDGELNAILPNLRNFGTAAGRPDYPTNLGFLG